MKMSLYYSGPIENGIYSDGLYLFIESDQGMLVLNSDRIRELYKLIVSFCEAYESPNGVHMG